MTFDEAIAIIQNEINCVERASAPIGACDRRCDKCDLVKEDTEIITAMLMAISALSYEKEMLGEE